MATATLGILMLDNAFDRFPGDLGNPASFDFPVLYARTPGATTEAITTISDDAFLAPFTAGALRLVEQGAHGIVTSCGFLAIYQRKLAACLPVPVATSALLQVAWVERLLPAGKRVSVLTFNGKSLGAPHFDGVDAPRDTPVVGLPEHGPFRRALLGDRGIDSFAAREADALIATRQLMSRYPATGAIVLECTNLVPHAAAIRAEAGVPVYDVMTLVRWFHLGLQPAVFARAPVTHLF
jgi:Asp/Glu/hydantoin racemase